MDDAVLSCGLLIQDLVSKGKKVIVVLVFTKCSDHDPTNFARSHLKLTKYSNSKALFNKRRFEDIQALRLLGAEYVHLGFVDAAWRKNDDGSGLYSERHSLFSGKALDGPDLTKKVSLALLGNKFMKHEDVVLFSPSGVGGHVDHIIVRDVVKGLGFEKYYWQDFPYSFIKRYKRINLEKFFSRSFTIKPKKNFNKKLKAIKKYKTEYRILFPNGTVPYVSERYFTKV